MAKREKKTASLAWLEKYNPLAGLSISAANSIFDAARGGDTQRLHWIYQEIETQNPVLSMCVSRRAGARLAAKWRVVELDASRGEEAAEQKQALEAFFNGIDNFSELFEHLDLALFRGFAHAQPIWEDERTVEHIELLDSWKFLKKDGEWFYNPQCDGFTSSAVSCKDARLISLVRKRPVDVPALSIHIRSAVGERDWGRFLERYALPKPAVTMAENASNEDKANYTESASALENGQVTVWPYGTTLSDFAGGSRGVDPFSTFITHQEKAILMLSTGGTLGSMAEAGSGTLAGNAQADVWQQICAMDANLIAGAINRALSKPFLEAAFPGSSPLVRFEFDLTQKPTPKEIFEIATTAKSAGYMIDKTELEEATGFTLEIAPESPQGSPDFGIEHAKGFNLNAKGFRIAENAQDAQEPASDENALESKKIGVSRLADSILEIMAEEAAKSLAGGKAENMREYKRDQNGQFSETDNPSDFKPGENPDSAETQAAEIGKGKAAIAKCLKEKRDIPNAVSRGDVGLISLRYGDEKSGLAHFKDRADTMNHLAETLVHGKAGEAYQQGQKLNITHGGYVATLALTNSPEHSGYPKNWVLTSFGPKDKAKGAAL